MSAACPASAQMPVPEEAKKSWKRLLSGPTIDFYIGPDRKHWSLHRNLLCHHSPYFEAEFLADDASKDQNKSGEQKLDLPDHDPAGFELLVKWLYQGTLDDVSDMSDEKKYDYSVACHKLYMLCDQFDLPYLRNVSIDQYRQGLLQAQLVPDAEEINEIYRRSPSGSPFRKLMTQIAARQIMDPDTEKDAESYRKCFNDNPDFAVDMVNAIKAGTGGVLFEDPTDGDECDYHEHIERQNCHSKGKGPAKPKPTSPRTRQSPTTVDGARNPAIERPSNGDSRPGSGTRPTQNYGLTTPPPSGRRDDDRLGVGRFGGLDGTARDAAKGQVKKGGRNISPPDSGGESPRRKPKKLVLRGSAPTPQRQASP